MHFVFQESKIWDATKEPARFGAVHKVKAQSEAKARKRLPKPEMGRDWILVDSYENAKEE